MKMQSNIFPYKWNLKDGFPAKGVKKNKYTVFGTFSCGGGSSMGFKLAGYDTLGGVEIDPRIARYYKDNLHPKHFYEMDIRKFNQLSKDELPEELFHLDVLEGSPPCSTFSMAGIREKAWGKKKRFAEGQALQTLDDLVFVYADTILKLLPKVFVLENVAGLVAGNAKNYVREIVKKLSVKYKVQIFDLNGANMGLPQMRERVFIVGYRNDFSLPPLQMNFNDKLVPYKEICEGENTDKKYALTEREMWAWERKKPTDKSIADVFVRNGMKENGFTIKFVRDNRVTNTVTSAARLLSYTYPRTLTLEELRLASSFPQDYKCEDNKLVWLMGMSVPPLMMANLANQIRIQWLDKINED